MTALTTVPRPGHTALGFYTDLRVGVLTEEPVKVEDAADLVAAHFSVKDASYCRAQCWEQPKVGKEKDNKDKRQRRS